MPRESVMKLDKLEVAVELPQPGSADFEKLVSEATISPVDVTGLCLPKEFTDELERKADLLERLLSRMEAALGLEPIL